VGGAIAGIGHAARMLFGRTVGTHAVAHAAYLIAPIVTVNTSKGQVRFWCPSRPAAKRALKLLRAEPETCAWIDSMVRAGEHVWDVGANVGAYTLYACLGANVSVTAFEPVAGTFAVLSRNIQLNAFEPRATALCVALSNADGLAPMFLTSSEPGAAMHALAEARSVGGAFEAAGNETVLTMRGDELVRRFGVTSPDHIKIDVDGHELRVLEGLEGLLPSVRTVWIEMLEAADTSGENEKIDAFLRARGFAAQVLAPGRTGRNRMYVNV
jgi:FkbM family methyltransferase